MSAKNLSKGEIKVINGYTGCAAETAKNIGMSVGYVEKLLRKDYVKAGIKQRADDEKQIEAVAHRVERQTFWSSVMRGEPQVVEVEEVKDKKGRIVEVRKTKKVADIKNRLRASELLGRSEADFVDKYHMLGTKEGVKKEITDEMDQKEASNIYFEMLHEKPAGNA